MPALSAVQSSCAFASPDPLDQAIQQELAALAAAKPLIAQPVVGWTSGLDRRV